MKNILGSNLYKEDGHHGTFYELLPNETYIQTMRLMTIVCSDIYLIRRNEEKLFLARRIVKPAQNKLWAIGGRKLAMEKPEDAAVRHIKNDLGLNIGSTRLQLVSMDEYFWQEVQQEPQNQGSDNLCFTFALDISLDELEIARRSLSEAEYDLESGINGYNYENLCQNLDHLVYMGKRFPTMDFYRKIFD